MRWSLLVLSLFASACSVLRMLPEGPALDPEERATFVEAPSGAAYSGEALTSFPVLPVLAFGFTYDVDLVLISHHPEWNMHEYGRMKTPDGPLWIAKDARESTMQQSFIAGREEVRSFVPEGGIFERKFSPVEVEDRSTEDWLDLTIRYENIDGKPVEVSYEGKAPFPNQKKRNGSTMGHSRDAALVALDVEGRVFGKRASIRIDGKPYKLERALGLVPFKLALLQTQGGFLAGSFRQEPTWQEGTEIEESAFAPPGEMEDANPQQEGGPTFDSIHEMVSSAPERRSWEVESFGDYLHATQTSKFRTLTYRFRRGERNTRELVSATAEVYGYDTPAAHIVFSPALPDLGHRFHGTVKSRYAIDINGQEGHAVGRIECTWGAEGPIVKVLPDAPRWTTDRPMTGTFALTDDGGVDVEIVVDRDED